MNTTTAPLPSNHNGGPPLVDPSPFDVAKTTIEDFYLEALNWADGEPIETQEVHDEIERLSSLLAESGKAAEALRVAEKQPLDIKVKEIQDRYNPLIQDKKGKVAKARTALGVLLAAWREKEATKKAEIAAQATREAEELERKAQEAIRASAGNLERRDEAEELLAEAKDVQKYAKRAVKSATTNLGLRTNYTTTLTDIGAALDWCFEEDSSRFTALAQQMAEEAVRSGVRSIPGFAIKEYKTARG